MGYSHSWTRPQIVEAATFAAIGNDLRHLLPALEAVGAPIANPYGREEAEIGPNFIGFNGVACCGHEQNLNVRLPWPEDGAHGIGGNHGIGSSLPYRTCNGDCSYESVWFERCLSEQGGDITVNSFCKTNFRPYDLAVMAFLVIAKHHLSEGFTVETDGNSCHWAEAITLCQAHLGYGAGFDLDAKMLRIREGTLTKQLPL